MSLIHEVPTGLRVRPTVTIRHIARRAIRLLPVPAPCCWWRC
jgi:hypothetical protein